MSPRKLMFWLFACIFLVCALRAGLLTSADQYIYHYVICMLLLLHIGMMIFAIPPDCCYVRVKTYRSKEP